MRILQVIPVLSATYGGPVAVVRFVSKGLSRKHAVTVYTTGAVDQRHDLRDSPFEVDLEGYHVVYFPRIFKTIGFSISPDMARRLKGTLREYDVVHVHSWRHFQDVVVHHYAKKYGVPYVLQAHGSIPRIMGKRGLKWLYDFSIGHKVLACASKVIALSKTEARQYNAAGVHKDKIAIVPNGMDLSDYKHLPSSGHFKAKYGISDCKRIILYLGRIHRTKGIDLLVKAYTYLIKNKTLRPDETALVIAGPDDGYLPQVKSLVYSSDISGSVLFTGFISNEDKLAALVDAELFVTPCFYGFPMTLLEACATGTPIVTTKLGDTLEWIDNNVGYVSLPTPSSLANAISRIVADRRLRRRLSQNCLRIVKSKFSLEKAVRELEQVYAEVTNK